MAAVARWVKIKNRLPDSIPEKLEQREATIELKL